MYLLQFKDYVTDPYWTGLEFTRENTEDKWSILSFYCRIKTQIHIEITEDLAHCPW